MSSTTKNPFSLTAKKRALVELLLQKQGRASSFDTIVPRRQYNHVPLSFAQQRLWFLDQLEPGSAFYNVPAAVRLQGHLDIEALERTLTEIVRRHEVLRTTFQSINGEAVQVIAPAAPLRLFSEDLSGLEQAEREETATRLIKEEGTMPFDLSTGPLLRVRLLRLGTEEHIVALTMHHIVSDGWSMGLLLNEIASLYRGFGAGEGSPLAELPIQYADYAVWQREWLQGEVLEAELGYWREQLGGELPVLELPTDRPRPAVQSYRGAREFFRLEAAAAEPLRRLSQAHDCTLFMTLLAAFQTLLYRYSGQEEILVGTDIAGRNRAEVEPLIGFFVNQLVLRGRLSAEMSFLRALQSVRESTLGAYAHQELPFEKLVEELQPERDAGRSPLFQVKLVLQNAPAAESFGLPGLRMSRVGGETGAAKFDLTLALSETGESLTGALEYNTDLFEQASIKRLLGHFENVLRGIGADAEQRLSELPLLSAGEQQQIVAEWNETTAPYAHEQSVTELFEAQVARTPTAVAVVYGSEQLSYAELNSRANQVGHYLRKLGVGPETLVGLCVERGPGLVVGLLGILKAGGAYVPLDPEYPVARLSYMLEDAGPAVLLTEAQLAERMPAYWGWTVKLDEEWEEIAPERRDNPHCLTGPEHAAYVIYTSGSTGEPKGVVLSHRGVCNLVQAQGEWFGIDAQARVLQFASLSFDASVSEILVTLCGGARLVLGSQEELQVGTALQAVLQREGVTVVTLPPSVLAVQEVSGMPRLATLVSAGAACSGAVVRKWRGAVQRLLNAYGPTEATVCATVSAVGSREWAAEENVPIGRGIGNVEVYVLGAGGAVQPVGVVGELYIGGVGVGRGYLGRPRETAERFIPNPFSAEGGARLYRTGDFAKWRADGELEFIGRVDEQVKVRGYRIELGEIEAALLGHGGVREAVVVARDERLVGYVVGDEQSAVSPASLREYLAERLPSYMVPGALVQLTELPLTPNGKVDRKALALREDVGERSNGASVLPRTAAEELLASIWAGVLRLERVGVEENFFELGGHSLLATQVMSRVREVFGVEVPLRSLFEQPTVAGLAGKIETALRGERGVVAPSLERVSRERELPLSFAQQRLWFLDQLEPGSAFYNVPTAVRLQGQLNIEALERTLSEIVRRHEVLRTTFQSIDGEAVQVIAPAAPLRLFGEDLSGLVEDEREETARRLIKEEGSTPFDLSTGPLLRVKLLRLAVEEHIVALTMHHIVSDGWSMGVLIKELAALYRAYSAGQESPLAELPLQYADYAVWQREWLQGEVLEAELGYWRKQLGGELPVLELPTDRPRPAVQSYRGAREFFKLGKEESDKLKELSQAQGCTLYMTLLAAFQTLLHRYSGKEEIIVGSPIAGRNRVELENLIGFFINTLVLRTDLSGGPTFVELLKRVREVALGAYAHQDVAFEKLVDELQPQRDLSRSPLFQVMFALQNAAGDKSLELPGLKFSVLNTEDTTTKFDLTLSLAEGGGVISGALEYNTDLFNQETVIRMLGHFQVLLQSIVEHNDQPITHLRLLSPEEQRQIVTEWNDTTATFPDSCLHQFLETQAERVPESIAVSFEDQHLSYFELNARANQLAHHLRTLGVGPEMLVGICLERSLEMVVGIFGILKAGAAYVPLDPEYPRERLDFMAQDAGLAVLLTQAALWDALPEYAGPIIRLDADWPRIADQSTSNPKSLVTPDNLAYMIFTSGSTGRPKGTMNTHSGICNRLFWMQAEYQLTAADRVLQKTPFSFDVSVWEFFWPSLAGAELVLAAPGGHRDPAYLIKTIREREISTLHFVPSMLQAFLEAPEVESCRSVRQVMSSGEALPVDLVEKFRQRLGAELHNLYGPTEAAVDVSYWSCTREKLGRTIPIGRPVANTQLLILDGRGEVVPAGIAGELHIGGVQVGRGYHRRGDLTAEKFIPNAYSTEPGARLYRTGDVARYQPDGAIEYLGRMDEQVKVRGFRIELGEIEAVLQSHTDVREAAVLALSDDQGRKTLAGYIVPTNVNGESQLVSNELRRYLASRLPDYMVPATFVVLDQLPLSPSGKLDRRSLPRPDFSAHRPPRSFVAPRTERERVLAGIWAEVLRRDQIGVHDNFFEIGGDSIISIQIVARAHKAGLRLTPKQMFQFQTVAELASAAETSDATVIAEQSIITGEVPLTPIQHWFFEQKLERREHFTQSVLFELQERIEIEPLAAVVKLLLQQHDALRLRYQNAETGWKQISAGVEDSLQGSSANGNLDRALVETFGSRITPIEDLPLLLIDLATVPPTEHSETIERCCSLLQSSLNLSDGPICRFVLFDVGPFAPQRLFIVIHHLAVDGVSWRILLDDLQSALAQQRRGLAIDLGPKSSSFQSWARRLVAHAASDECISELPYWLSAERQRVPQLNGRTGRNRFGSTAKVDSALNKEHTRALLQEAPAAYHTQINDLLIAALAEAYARHFGHRMLLIDMEGHGRQDLFAEIDLSRTVGWLTTLHPVLIDVRDTDGAGSLIKSVKEQLRQVPTGGFNYGVLRYLSPDPEVSSQLRNMPQAQVGFNYLGQLDGVIGEQKRLRPARESKGGEQDPAGERAHRYMVNGAVVGGQLRMSWFYSPELDDRESVEELAAEFNRVLQELVQHCLETEVGSYTPSDFPLASINMAALDRIMSRVGQMEVEDIYPLTPMQQGMLFHALMDEAGDAYFDQMLSQLEGEVDLEAFGEAWQQAVQRHVPLRTSFQWEGLEQPLQVVARKALMSIEQEDWRGIGVAEQQERLGQLRREDRVRGFQLTVPPLMRLKVLRMSEQHYQLLWSFHHLLLDGWSVSLLLNEVFTRYRALLKGRPVEFEPAGSYRDYIEWLRKQSLEKAEEYWRNELRGIEHATVVNVAPANGKTIQQTAETADERYGEQRCSLSREQSEAIQEMTRAAQITMNTVVQGAWAVLLNVYSGDEDVIFGSVVSGRPPELRGIEEMVGSFINTLPVRVKVDSDRRVEEWLRQLQHREAERREFEHSPLVQVQGWSEVSRGESLFESLVIFQNHPAPDHSLKDSARDNQKLKVGAVQVVERVNYPLCLKANNSAQGLFFSLLYDRHHFDDETIERIRGHLERLLVLLATGRQKRVGDLELLTEAERRQLLVEWNSTAADYPSLQGMQQLFEAQVERTPNAIAVVHEGDRITYTELNRRANQLAHYLRGFVGPEELVAVCMQRSIEMIVALLGVLKAGAAYVPCDPLYPEERLRFMLEDTAAPVLLTQQHLIDHLPPHQAKVICVDSQWAEMVSQPDQNPNLNATADNFAYVIYTSGSTGTPKGVAIEHHNALTFLHWAKETFTPQEMAGVLASTSICFDLSIFEIFATLSAGGKVILVEDALALASLETAGEVTLINTVPSAIAELVRLKAIPASVRTINLAGEVLKNALVQEIYKQETVREVYNLYGPSEDTTYSTFTRIEKGQDEAVSIGRPIANTQVYLLDQHLRPTPVGVAGELYLAGEGLARGYLNRPDLTAERFIPNPFNKAFGAFLYRTGDQARYRSDGKIEYLGRLDQQVKVRGYRIEFGEIEAVLSQHSEVLENVVVAREDASGNQQLVAYVVTTPDNVPSPSELHAFLKARLPAYMATVALVFMNELPRTPNGKLDRKALPEPANIRDSNAEEYIAPRSAIEELVSAIWSDVLKVETIGRGDNFFDLGGHSLLGTQIASRIREVFSVGLPLRILFERPTVREVSEAIEALLRGSDVAMAPALERISRDTAIPLSFGQQRLWFLDQLEPESPFYNLHRAVRFNGELNVEALEHAFNEVVQRHESLRTTFQNNEGEVVQIIHPPQKLRLTVEEVSGRSRSEREAEVARLAFEESNTPFDLANGPLLRFRLLRVDADEHVVLVTMHHIISDGWSMGLFVQEVGAFYKAFSNNEQPLLPPLPIQYADYAVWQRNWLSGETLEAELAYWKKQLGGELPVLELPADRPRPPVQTYRGSSEFFSLPAEVSEQLQQQARLSGCTMYMTLLAAFQTLLARYSGQDDIVVGTAIAGRDQAVLEQLIGYFANTLVMRTHLSAEPSFMEVLRRVKEVALQAYAHQALPVEKLVEEIQPNRDLSRSPLFQVMLILQNAPTGGALRLPGLSMQSMGGEINAAKMDLLFSLGESHGRLVGQMEYNIDLFDSVTIKRVLSHFGNVLSVVAADPHRSINDIDLMSAAEREQLLSFETESYPHEQCIHELFEAQVERSPDSIALVFGDEQLTYAELNGRANQLAHHLRALGVGPEVLVGICLKRGSNMLVALLGVLKAGGAYVPLDPQYPRERLHFMLADADPKVLVTEEHLRPAFAEQPVHIICIDSDGTSLAELPVANLPRLGSSDNAAYVIYTSGSTGTPKGVVIAHRNVAALTAALLPRLELSAHEVWTLFHSFAFDFSVWEIWGALHSGATLVIVPASVARSPQAFLQLLKQQRVTVVNQTPSAASQLLLVAQDAESEWRETSVRRLFVGGEALPPDLAQALMSTGIPLCNFYGPTEATVWAAIKPLEPGAPVTIGRPIANTQLYVLDRAGRIVPAGVVGELYIGGAGLGRGYWKRPELTAQSFIPHPYSHEASGRLYRTGDLARYRADGEIEYVGRADYQVKVRGFRIELGEIEAALMDHPQVREAVAIVRENERGDRRLLAYVSGNGELTGNELRESVTRRLPEYMVPNSVFVLERLPQTANGKIDRQALAELDHVRPETAATHQPPRNELERQIAAAWMEALKIDQVGVDQNFFDLGGHSMLLAQVHLHLQKILGRELALVDFFKYPTVSMLARFISQEARQETSAVEIDARTEERKDKLKKQRQTRQKARSAVAAHGKEA